MKDIFRKHQERIAYKTLQVSDEAVFILGGMTKEEARIILAKEVVKTFKKDYPESYKVFAKMNREIAND